jgi:hypothetical protein
MYLWAYILLVYDSLRMAPPCRNNEEFETCYEISHGVPCSDYQGSSLLGCSGQCNAGGHGAARYWYIQLSLRYIFSDSGNENDAHRCDIPTVFLPLQPKLTRFYTLSQNSQISNKINFVIHKWPPLWSSGQSFWLQILRSRVRVPALLDFSE